MVHRERLRFLDTTTSESNVKHGIVRDVPCVILMQMGNGEVVEVMTIESTSVEECGRREFVVVRFVNSKMTKTHQEHIIFEDAVFGGYTRTIAGRRRCKSIRIIEFQK